MEIKTEYEIGQEVSIKAISTIGRISAFFYGETGLQYQIVYFIDGERKTLYFYSSELSKPIGTEKLGYNTG